MFGLLELKLWLRMRAVPCCTALFLCVRAALRHSPHCVMCNAFIIIYYILYIVLFLHNIVTQLFCLCNVICAFAFFLFFLLNPLTLILFCGIILLRYYDITPHWSYNMEKKGYKLYVLHTVGKNDTPYYALVLDLGYTKKYLGFGSSLCAEVLDCTPRELDSMCPLGSTAVLVEF